MVRSRARRRLTPAQRRARILDAATEVFAEAGYERAAMVDIARRAGVVASVLYDHFPGKRDIYIELIALHSRALTEHTRRARRAASARATVHAQLEAFYGFIETNPFACRLLFRDAPEDTAIRRAHRHAHKRASGFTTELVRAIRPEQRRLANVARPNADAMLGEAIKAATNGLATWWLDHPEVRRDDVVAVIEALLWDGLSGLITPGSVTSNSG